MMQFLVTVMLFMTILTDVFGGNSKSKNLDDPGSSRNDMKDGCIYKGEFINAELCDQLCRNFFKDNMYLAGIAEGYCEFEDECKCKYPAFRNDGSIRYTSVADLEEIRLKNSKKSEEPEDTIRQKLQNQPQAGPSYLDDQQRAELPSDLEEDVVPQNKRCSYRDIMISEQECERRCLDFVSKAGITGGTDGQCEDYGSCRCMVESKTKEGFVSYERLDTLEAQFRSKEVQKAEQERKDEGKKESKSTIGRILRLIQDEMIESACSQIDPEFVPGSSHI